MITEDKVSDYASEVVDQSVDGDLTTSLRGVVDKYGLNKFAAREVCAKTNHIVFTNGFGDDHLTSFKKADFEKAVEPDVVKESGEYISGTMDYSVEMEKTATENTEYQNARQADNYSKTKRQIGDAILKNAEDMEDLKNRNDNMQSEMKKIIIALLQSGESLTDICKSLQVVMDGENRSLFSGYFKDLMDNLVSEGYLTEDEKIDIPENGLERGQEGATGLMDVAGRIKKTASEIMEKEIIHSLLLDKYASYATERDVLLADHRTGEDWYIAKKASFLIVDYFNQKEMQKEASKTDVARYWKTVIPFAVAAAIVPPAIGGIQNMSYKIKAKELKGDLKERFPELKKIPNKQYDDIYESVTNMAPALVKSPYFLAEAIKKPVVYGTIDTSEVKQLSEITRNKQSSSKKDIGPGLQSVVQGIGQGLQYGVAAEKNNNANANLKKGTP